MNRGRERGESKREERGLPALPRLWCLEVSSCGFETCQSAEYLGPMWEEGRSGW